MLIQTFLVEKHPKQCSPKKIIFSASVDIFGFATFSWGFYARKTMFAKTILANIEFSRAVYGPFLRFFKVGGHLMFAKKKGCATLSLLANIDEKMLQRNHFFGNLKCATLGHF